jgi:hypothetical protein
MNGSTLIRHITISYPCLSAKFASTAVFGRKWAAGNYHLDIITYL